MPFVGITTSLTGSNGTPRAQLNVAYLDALQAAGGIPVLLPPQLREAQFAALVENLDGLLLTGGGDVDPARYNAPLHVEVRGVSVARDTLELTAARWALGARKPIFAICRGMQLLNVALGGTLFPHIPEHFGEGVLHDQAAAGMGRSEIAHSVDVRGGSLLANLVGAGSLGVNSMHHQAVRRPGDHIIVTARASDGVIEAVEAPTLGEFILGVQWHPEELAATNEAAARLFSGFVAACGGERVGAPERTHAIRV
jgi:putative glutamine amidotransferase